MRKISFFVGIVFFFFAVSFLALPVQAKELLIGVSAGLSGGAAPTGLALLRSLELGVEEINDAGGIKVGGDSYLLKLLVYDSKYDAREGVAVANKLIYRDRAKYVVTMGAPVIVAVNPLITENKIFQFVYSYGGKKVTNPNAPYTFRIHLEPIQGHLIVMPWIVEKYGLKNMALASNDDETGLVQSEDAESVAKKLGLTITDKVFTPRGTPDFTPMLTKLIAKNPQAIEFGSLGGSEGPLACKQAKEIGYKGLYIFSYTQSIPTFEKVAGDFMDGVLFYGIFPDDPTPLAAKLRKRYEAKYKQRFDALIYRNYDALFVLKKAIETAGTLDTTAVRDTMAKVSINGVLGPTRVGGKSYYGIDTQFLFPFVVSTFDAKQKKFVELYRGSMPPDY